MEQWQPIDTAPMSIEVLGWVTSFYPNDNCGGGCVIMSNLGDEWLMRGGAPIKPTHWMRLPDEPFDETKPTKPKPRTGHVFNEL